MGMVGPLSLIEGVVWPPRNSKGIVEPLLGCREDNSTTNESPEEWPNHALRLRGSVRPFKK
jgi:hypothetical protein